MKLSKMLIEAEVGGESSVIANLKSMGFDVQANEEGSSSYTVSKDGMSALLDLSTSESMADSMATINSVFNIEDPNNPDFPIMSQQSSDHKLAQRVAAIGESKKIKLPIQATSAHRGKTYHHDVYLIEPDEAVVQMQNMLGKKPQATVQIDKTPGNWYVEDFMRGNGPLSIDFGSGWVLVNADEIRDAIVNYQTDEWEKSGGPQNVWNKIKSRLGKSGEGEQSFAESNQGLWHNIHAKRKRMGKNYRPAKPGQKGRPKPEAWKNAGK